MSRIARAVLAADIVGVIVSFFTALTIRYRAAWLIHTDWSIPVHWLPVILSVVVIWTVVFARLRLDGFCDGWHAPSIAANLMLGELILITSLLAIGFITRQYYSRFVICVFAAVSFLVFFLVRLTARLVMLSLNRSRGARRVVIVGSGNVANELARKIQRHPELRREFAGFLFPTGAESTGAPDLVTPTTLQMSQSASSLGIPELLRASSVQELILCLPETYSVETAKLISLCREKGFDISIVPQWYELYVSRVRLVDFEGLPIVSLQQRPSPIINRVIKRLIDLAVAPVLAIVAAPVMLAAATALKIRKGRGWDREIRCGLNGREFGMWRLNVQRGMPIDRFEAMLLDLSVTEIPQLWNVISGDMTLVGPRPEPPVRVRHYSEWQRQRMSVVPGLTGLAQVYGLRDIHSSEEKARFDLQYIYHWSPFTDFALLLQTLWTLMSRLFRPVNDQRTRAAIFRDTRTVEEALDADRTHSCAD